MKKVSKSRGSTDSERYLAKICENTFLSLWSYPNLYIPEGKRGNNGSGRELCDLLVLFDCHVIIFSDKDINFNDSIDLNVSWTRWYRKSILNSARQLHGAEKFIRQKPNEIFLNSECTEPFPFDLSSIENLQIHLIAVTKNSYKVAKKYFGGGSSGSLMLIPELPNEVIENKPFIVNDIDKSKTYVHVLDELSLDVVLNEFNTAYDFLRYISAKESAIRRGLLGQIAGEEDLVAYYILNGGLFEEDFPFDLKDKRFRAEFDRIVIGEGFWAQYLHSDERAAMQAANEISYFWDSLIEKFSFHILQGTVAHGQDEEVATHEQAIKWLAREGRFSRRVLSKTFIEKLQTTHPNMQSSRVAFSLFNKKACFLLVLFPRDHGEDYDSYRKDRVEILHSYGLVAKYKFPEKTEITVIGMEPKESDGRSEDILAISIEELTEEEKALAKEIMINENILNDVRMESRKEWAAPGLLSHSIKKPQRRKTVKVGPNEKCPCGSGVKYKKCCGKSA